MSTVRGGQGGGYADCTAMPTMARVGAAGGMRSCPAALWAGVGRRLLLKLRSILYARLRRQQKIEREQNKPLPR